MRKSYLPTQQKLKENLICNTCHDLTLSFLGLNSYATAGITAGIIVLVSIASFLSVVCCCWTSRRKPRALQVHVSNEPSTSDDYIPITMGTLGIPAVTSCPSLQSHPHEEKNLARSFSSANISALNEELLKLRSQRSRVKEMDAVPLFPSCDDISTSEPRIPFSPSLL